MCSETHNMCGTLVQESLTVYCQTREKRKKETMASKMRNMISPQQTNPIPHGSAKYRI